MGQDIQEFESQLREGISKKYKEIKHEFAKACRIKALFFLESDLATIKRNLSNDMYEGIDQFKVELDKLKTKFMENGPRFAGRIEII